MASQYQEELPAVHPVVRRFDIEVGHCSQCRRRVQGRHVLQTSDALGAAGVQFGPGVVALVVELHTEMGVPLAKVAHLLRTTFGLQVTPGGLAHVPHRAARAAAPAYTKLCEQVRSAPVVTPDETGWRVGTVRPWLWTFVTPDTTVYAICPGRGFDDAATVLGTDYVGVLVRDGWAPYRRYEGLHQTCLNHLLQRGKQLREDYPDSPWGGEVQAVLRAGLDLRDRCNAGALSEHGMATARGRLTARLGRLVDAPPPLDDAERFAAHLANEFPAVFLSFLWDPSLDATNWRAEQAIRPAVVIRKVCGGNRTRHGADTQQVLASIVRTARQRGLDLPPLIAAQRPPCLVRPRRMRVDRAVNLARPEVLLVVVPDVEVLVADNARRDDQIVRLVARDAQPAGLCPPRRQERAQDEPAERRCLPAPGEPDNPPQALYGVTRYQCIQHVRPGGLVDIGLIPR